MKWKRTVSVLLTGIWIELAALECTFYRTQVEKIGMMIGFI